MPRQARTCPQRQSHRAGRPEDFRCLHRSWLAAIKRRVMALGELFDKNAGALPPHGKVANDIPYPVPAALLRVGPILSHHSGGARRPVNGPPAPKVRVARSPSVTGRLSRPAFLSGVLIQRERRAIMDNEPQELAAAYLVSRAIEAQDFIAAIFDGGAQ